MDENVLMVLKGELAKMMVHNATQIYCTHITVDKKGSPVLYVKLQKALYGLQEQVYCITESCAKNWRNSDSW